MPNHERGVATSINGSWPVLERYFDGPEWHASGTDPASIMSGMPWGSWVEQAGEVVQPLADATAQAFGAEYATIGSVRGKLGFDVIDEVSVKYAQTQGSKLIAAIGDAQRQTVRTMVAESLRGDWTVDQLGRRLRDTVGLHPAWAQAVVRFEERQYAALIKEGKTPAVAQATAARRAEVKRKRLLKRRGENIARTEIQTASNLGKFASWEHAINNKFASPQSTKEFSPGPEACDICSPLSGEVVPWNEPFSNGKMMPPFHPSCRCTANLLPPDYNDEELDPDAFDWLSDADVMSRPTYKPELAGRVGSLVNRPAPYVAPPVVVPPAPLPAPAPTGTKADELTLQSTAHMSDDELNDLLVELSADDPEAVDKILEIFDQRDIAAQQAAAFNAAEEARLAAEAAAHADDGWGIIPEEFMPGTGTLSGSPVRGLTPDQQVDEDYYAYIGTQHAKALNDTNGNFFKPEYRGKGLDEFMLFEGSTTRARKYASEELIAWWEENGRHTKASFRYGALGRPGDYKGYEQVLRQGFGGKLGGPTDRSTF